MTEATISQADWDAVAQERAGDKAPPAQEASPEQKVETPPVQAEAQKTEEAADPYAGLHPVVRAQLAKFDEIAATLPNVLNEVKAATGRVGALQSEWARTKQSLEAPSAKQVAAAAKDPEKWAALKNDFPEWGDGISEYVEARLGQLAGSGLSAEQVEQLVAQRTESVTTELTKKFNEALVEFKHKGWRDEVKKPEFAAWFAAQPAEVQALQFREDSDGAIAMLDLYAEHKAKPVAAVKQGRQERLQAAVTTTKQGAGAATRSFEEMSPQEQWDYLARQRDKQA